ncbi:chromo domain-like protein, partial [Gautieria morchelliformis]
EQHYVVNKIIDSHLLWGCLQFLIKWEGYSYHEYSWVSEDDVCAPAKVQEFYQTH